MFRLASVRALSALRPSAAWPTRSARSAQNLLPHIDSSPYPRRCLASTPGPHSEAATAPASADHLSQPLRSSVSPHPPPPSSGIPPPSDDFASSFSASGEATSKSADFPSTPLGAFDIPKIGTSPGFVEGVQGPVGGFETGDATIQSAEALSSAIGMAASDGGGAGADAAAAVASSWSDIFLVPVESWLSLVHTTTGLPWWSTIVVATVGVRCMMLPLSLYTMRNAAKVGAIQEDLKGIRDDMMLAIKGGNQPLAAKKQEEQQALMRSVGVAPSTILIGPLSQFPIMISFFIGIRKMSESNPDFAAGGVAWFQNLSLADPYIGLPLMSAATMLLMTELGGGSESGTVMTPTMKMAMRAVATISVPLTSWMPAALFCYWIPSNLFSALLSGSLQRFPGLKRVMGVAVDPAALPGTKAAARAARISGQASVGKPISASAAASSYVKANVKEVDSRVVAAVTQASNPPKLSRVRTKKKKARSKEI